MGSPGVQDAHVGAPLQFPLKGNVTSVLPGLIWGINADNRRLNRDVPKRVRICRDTPLRLTKAQSRPSHNRLELAPRVPIPP